MHAILVTVGTGGDVYPYLRLGRRLRSRGHRVTLAANANHERLAAAEGIDFRALVSEAETERRLANPDFWHPVKGPLLASEWGTGFLDEQFSLLSDLARERDAVLVGTPVVAAARLVQEKLGRPLASVLLQPWGIPSILDPPVMPAGFTLPRGMPRPLGRLYWGFIHGMVQLRFGRPLNRMRRSIGLPPVRRAAEWMFSPQLIVGLFPDWYAPPQADWPPQIRLAGFPLEDAPGEADLPDDLATFCAGEPAPLVFTFGTGMMHARRQFAAAIEACRRMGRRGIIVSRYAEHLPDPLPEPVLYCRYAPFRTLFPRCAAVVHHGGMGTLAAALAAGVPQLILPLAHDQPDNAARIKRLGLGDRLARSTSGARITSALARLLAPEVRARCEAAAARLEAQDSFETTVDWLEELSGDSRGPLESRA